MALCNLFSVWGFPYLLLDQVYATPIVGRWMRLFESVQLKKYSIGLMVGVEDPLYFMITNDYVEISHEAPEKIMIVRLKVILEISTMQIVSRGTYSSQTNFWNIFAPYNFSSPNLYYQTSHKTPLIFYSIILSFNYSKQNKKNA